MQTYEHNLAFDSSKKNAKFKLLEELYPEQMAFLRGKMTPIEILAFFEHIADYVHTKIECKEL